MNISDSGSSIESKPHKNTYEFTVDKGRKIIIDSDFDNGNIGLVKQVSQLHYRLEAVPDSKTPPGRKTWFHFRIKSPKYLRMRFMIDNVKIYEPMYEEKNWMKPVVREDKQWKEIKDAHLLYREQISLCFQYNFNTNQFVYFALTIPFTYQDSQQYLQQLNSKISNTIFYQDQILCKSQSNLNTHLLTISQNADRRKPIIFITARVHPGEVSSSYCLMGIIEFLLKSYNLQAYILRSMFTFLIIPMVNPEGVFEGNFRMDTNGINLNRIYHDPTPQTPTVFHIKELLNKTMATNRIFAHFDLHSHSSIKSAFIYGNALDQIVSQTQSQLYCKLLEQNSQIFKYNLSHFGEKHMKMKDKGQNLSKEGCARVVISKLANIVYSYTIQTSIFSYVNRENLSLEPKNTNWELDLDQNFTLGHEEFNEKIMMEKKDIYSQLIIDNMILGQNILITILDVLEKNPYSRFDNESLQTYRKEISQELFQTEERFKLLDVKAHQKMKAITRFLKESADRNNKLWHYLLYDPIFAKSNWPESFRPFERQVEKKKPRFKTQINEFKQINESLITKNPRKYFFQNLEFVPHKNTVVFLHQPLHRSVEKIQSEKHQVKPLSKKKMLSEEVIQNGQMKEIKKLRDKESSTVKQNIILDIIRDENMEKRKTKKQFPMFQKVVNHKLVREKKQSKSYKQIENNEKIQVAEKKITNICADLQSQRQQYLSSEMNNKKQMIKVHNHKKELTKMKFAQIKRSKEKSEFKLPQLRSGPNFVVYNRVGRHQTLPDQY